MVHMVKHIIFLDTCHLIVLSDEIEQQVAARYIVDNKQDILLIIKKFDMFFGGSYGK